MNEQKRNSFHSLRYCIIKLQLEYNHGSGLESLAITMVQAVTFWLLKKKKVGKEAGRTGA